MAKIYRLCLSSDFCTIARRRYSACGVGSGMCLLKWNPHKNRRNAESYLCGHLTIILVKGRRGCEGRRFCKRVVICLFCCSTHFLLLVTVDILPKFSGTLCLRRMNECRSRFRFLRDVSKVYLVEGINLETENSNFTDKLCSISDDI